MIFKTIVIALTAILIYSCTPDIEDDFVRLEFSNRTEYRLHASDSTDAAFVKVKYHAYPTRNGIFLGDTTYTENVLFAKRQGELWKHIATLDPDSGLFTAKREGDVMFFVAEGTLDSLFFTVDIETSVIDTLESFDYFSGLEFVFCDSAATAAIDGLSMFKTYRRWQDEIINLYR